MANLIPIFSKTSLRFSDFFCKMFNFIRFGMQKLYYSISEVSKLVDEEQHILRYWEKEFDQLKPKKNRGGNRIYSDKDIKLIQQIKQLLRDEKLSLKGAQEKIQQYYDGVIELPEKKTGKAPIINLNQSPGALIGADSQKGINFNKQEATELYDLLKDVLAVLK